MKNLCFIMFFCFVSGAVSVQVLWEDPAGSHETQRRPNKADRDPQHRGRRVSKAPFSMLGQRCINRGGAAIGQIRSPRGHFRALWDPPDFLVLLCVSLLHLSFITFCFGSRAPKKENKLAQNPEHPQRFRGNRILVLNIS